MADQTFTAGQILTAAQMSTLQATLGLVTVIPTAVTGGTIATNGIITVGNAVSSIVVSGAFSSSFDNYKIIMAGGVASATGNISCILGATVANYYSSRIKNQPDSGAPVGNGLNNTANWGYFAQGGTQWASVDCDMLNPNLARRTVYHGIYMLGNGASSEFGSTMGFLDNNTQYTAFTLTAAGGQTLTGGTISIYGYRK